MAELLNCDIVMKGGVTSGVVYPPAIHQLSRRFRFRNVGGTSAGAIAAVLTAAAEHGRSQGADPFDELAELPQRLGSKSPESGRSTLHALFQPQPELKSLFAILSALQRGGRTAGIEAAGRLVLSFPLAALLGGLAGLLLLGLVLAGAARPEPTRWAWALDALGVLCALGVTVAGVLVGAGIAMVGHARVALPGNFFGMCRGYSRPRRGKPQELTTWLHGLVQRLARREPSDPPLTFRDLLGDDPQNPRINLQMITSNLTHGRPYRLPFQERTFYFDPVEFGLLFPEAIVAWMIEHRRPPKRGENAAPVSPEGRPLVALPEGPDLPVVVAARMSLSFPLLVSAVPLYAIDRGRVKRKDRVPERCWFSDGGIASNFPVHFFDSLLPRWPTFAINLAEFHIDRSMGDRDGDVYMVNDNRGGVLESWNRFDRRTNPLLGFLTAILKTMQNWNDNVQLRMPGYRDRIAHVCLDASEGGLNLDMPANVIERLGDRGRRAAHELTARFADGQGEMSWDNHRWIRFRSALTLLEDHLERLARAYDFRADGMPTYRELAARKKGVPPVSYPLGVRQRRKALYRMELIALAGRLAQEPRFEQGSPKPRPILRIMPRI